MNEQKQINEMTSEEIGLLLAQQYQLLMQTNVNIQTLTQELTKRQETKKE